MNAPRQYHAHMYFESEQLAQAAHLREQVGQLFAVRLGRLFPMPIGPHPKGMFQIAFDEAQFGQRIDLEIRRLLDSLFDGAAGSLVAHLAEMDELSLDDLKAIEKQVGPARRGRRSSPRRTGKGAKR